VRDGLLAADRLHYQVADGAEPGNMLGPIAALLLDLLGSEDQGGAEEDTLEEGGGR
jgi:hypothetical protein